MDRKTHSDGGYTMSYTAMMAHTYSGDPYSVIGYYASRKLNGNRAIWNGFTLQTLGRYSGSKIIYPPAWWTRAALPTARPLDGELWHVTDNKDLVRSIAGQGIAKSVNDVRWTDLRYMVYDYKPYSTYPQMSINILPSKYCHDFYLNYLWQQRQDILHSVVFEHNLSRLKDNNIADDPYLQKCDQTLMTSAEQVKEYIAYSKAMGWEGIVFANPQGEYICNRTHDLLKSKPLYDHECYVNGIKLGDPDKKYAAVVGSLKCFLTWNEQVTSFKGGRDDMIGQRVSFDVSGMDDIQRSDWLDPDKRPKHIRFSFLEVSKVGIPQSPNYLETI
jgi:hypothetical protein